MAISVKQKIVIAAIIFYATFAWTAAAHAAIIKPANNLGLVGYWNLDEGKGTTAFDHSAGAHNGTLTSSPTWTTGKFGQALTFGAANNYVVASTPWPSSGSISEWVYPTAYADWISPSGWKTDPGVSTDGYILIDNGGNGTPGKWRAVFRPNVGGASEADVVALQNDVLNTWTHLTFTWSLSGTTYTTHLYVNGVDQGSATWTGTPGASGVGSFHFGNSGDFADNYFKGKVDDVHVYNRALSAAEVKSFYNQTAGTRYNSSASVLGNGSTLTQGLVGWWTFDGSTIGTTIQDSSGQGNNGYVGGGVATSSMLTQGKLGQALNFNGADGIQVASPGTSYIGVTVSAWIKPSALSGNKWVLSRPYGYRLGLSGTHLYCAFQTVNQVWNFCSTVDSATVSLNVWQHVLVTYNGSTYTYYLNGVAGANNNSQFSGNLSINNTPTLGIGAENSLINSFFSGAIDDVRVYNRVLSQVEITQLYQEGATKVASSTALTNGTTLANGLVGYWPFNGPDVTDKVYDRSGRGNNGYFYNGATSTAKVQGKLGQALNFSAGTSQEVVIGTAPAGLTFAYNQPFSMSVWAKPLGTVGSGVFDRIVTIAATANNFEYFIIANNNAFSFDVGKNAVGDNTLTSSTFSVGQWYHLVATFDGTNLSFYINGTSVGSTAYTFGALTSPNGIFSIGGAGSSANVFNGTLDEARVYSRALSATEVKQLYQLGK